MKKKFRVYDKKQKKVVDYYNTCHGAFASVRGGNYRHTQEHRASDCMVQTWHFGKWQEVDDLCRPVTGEWDTTIQMQKPFTTRVKHD